MPVRICMEPRCPELATYRGRCPAHTTKRNRQTRSANKPIYNRKRWQILRRRKLFETPLCERCPEIATDVHHRTDIQDGGDPWDLANLESLCHACHSRETRRRMVA